MKEYIVLKINNNTLIFDYRTITNEEIKLVNNDNFMSSTLYYDLKYFKKNINKIINRIRYIDTLRIERLITFKYASDIINILNIKILILNFLSTIDKSDYELFLNCKSLNKIYCYYMTKEYISKFKNNNVEVDISAHINISDKFKEKENIDDIDALYYKKVIAISEEYPELINDLKEFLKVNYKLKAIHICVYSKDLIRSIVDLVKNDESRNVVVFLHQEYDKGNFIVNNFQWLKKLSEECNKEYTCEFRIIYSHSFLKNNLFKQLTFNNLKLIMIMCFYISAVSLIVYKSYQYIEEMSIASLNNELAESYQYDDEEEDLPDEQVDEEDVYDTSDSDDISTLKEDKKTESKYTFENSLSKLKKINKETVGYLVVKNTKISYPVVQHSNNSYYLKYDIYKKKNYMGWIYMDYRNNSNDFDDNTIIYGHNMGNGTMFGTLRQVLNSSWRKEEENMIITLDTGTGTHKFKIFSAYKVNYTTDYLVTSFETTSEKEAFIKMIKNRSSFKSKQSVKISDKILTLSTCTGSNNKRLVVHAVLIDE